MGSSVAGLAHLVLSPVRRVCDTCVAVVQAMALSYVEDNARVNFCPSVPWCGHAVQVSRPRQPGWLLGPVSPVCKVCV